MYNQKENGLQGVGAATSSLTTMISIRQQIILADDSAWRKQLNVRGFAALMVAALAGCSSTPASTSAYKADPQQSRIVRNEAPSLQKTRAVATASVSAPPVRAATTENILDVCDRSITGSMKTNLKIRLWESMDNPSERNLESIRESIRLLERTNIQMSCKVMDAGKSVYLYGQAIDFVMMHAKREKVLKEIYDIEFHQIAMAVRLSGNQMILDGSFGGFHSETYKMVNFMFKEIIRLRKKYRQSQDAIDSANQTLVGVMAGVASYFLIAKALNRILPETPSSSSVSGSVAPAREPTWTISHKKGHFEIKCSNKPSFTYSLSACGNMGIFDNRGHYREGMGGCHYKSVEQAARDLCRN